MMHQEKSELKSDLQQENTTSKDLKGTLDIGTRTHLCMGKLLGLAADQQ